MRRNDQSKLNKKRINKFSSRQGMTMAETLVTVAIIIILMGVVFIALSVYQRNMAQKERDMVAKEIYVAAQNHLTLARGEGYAGQLGTMEIDDISTSGTKQSDEAAFQTLGVNSNSVFAGVDGAWEVMLPFGSIEETVRTSDSYIIRYDATTAKVKDVFFGTVADSPSRFNYPLNSDILSKLDTYAGEDKKDTRRDVDGKVLGWYGGEGMETLPYDLVVPEISVENDEKLIVTIANSNFGKDAANLKLLVTGLTSGAKMAVVIDDPSSEDSTGRQISTATESSAKKCRLVLDDITTSSMHFADLNTDTDKTHISFSGDKSASGNNPAIRGTRFIPGEDIKIEAVAYSSTKLCRIKFSEAKTDNSLFESIDATDTASASAFVSNFRHLQNLGAEVSGVSNLSSTGNVAGALAASTNGAGNGATHSLVFKNAKQTKDLDWGKDGSIFNDSCSIYSIEGDLTKQYRPVNVSSLTYDGLKHHVKDVHIGYSGSSGMFGAPAGSTFKNLELIDFKVAATGANSAGALAGTMENSGIENVIAYNTNKTKYEASGAGVSSASGVAGGLVGEMKGGSATYSAASLKVSGGSAAGGLIGKAESITVEGSSSDTTITQCYSGGHTDNGEYYEHETDGTRKESGDEYVAIYNVEAGNGGAAGGLIGSAGASTITNSYSTCSAKGKADSTGGLLGTSGGASITKCYATGLVSGDNAFVGSGSINKSENNKYFKLINQEANGENGNKGMKGKEPGVSAGIQAMDKDAESFDDFEKSDEKWNPAGYKKGNDQIGTYDEYLTDHYKGKYNLVTVTQLAAKDGDGKDKPKDKITDSNYFVNTHYGDWPSPEGFIVNF